MTTSTLQCKLQGANKTTKAHDSICVSDRFTQLDITFQRTIRVGGGNDASALPPGLGTFPLYPVSAFDKQLPQEMVAKGGLFLPMYQREAMWIRFRSCDQFAIKIYVGGINAISGEPMIENAATQLRRQKRKANGQSIQDYVITPDQRWIDGIASAEGIVRQFVAMPMGTGYSVEAQVTGHDLVGGLQFEITSGIEERLGVNEISIHLKSLDGKTTTLRVLKTTTIYSVKSVYSAKSGITLDELRFIYEGRQLEDGPTLQDYRITRGKTIHVVLRLRGGGGGPVPIPYQAQMGVAAGGLIKQCILEDRYPANSWNHAGTIHFNVQILSSEVFRSVTGLAPPKSPISPKTYADLGLPFYQIWNENSTVKGDFEVVKSVKMIDKAKAAEAGQGCSVSAEPEEEEEEDQCDGYKALTNRPLVLLEPDGTHVAFRPVSELNRELARKKTAQF